MAYFPAFRRGIRDLISANALRPITRARDIYKPPLVRASLVGTVADFGIFSRTWAGGPILFNTMSRAVERLKATRHAHH